MKKLLKLTFALLSSFGLATVLLLLLLLLTFLGTLEQTERGLYEVQKEYFESLVLVHHLGVVPIPLPGAYLLLAVLSLNLILGGVVRIRKSRATIGVLICHAGILLMVAAGLVKFKMSADGQLTLYERDSGLRWRGDEFQSHFEWEVSITEVGSGDSLPDPLVEHVIPGNLFVDLAAGGSRTFTVAALPFDLRLVHFYKHCEALPKGPMFTVDVPVIDGYFLRDLPLNATAERNAAGAYIELIAPEGVQQGILWAGERHPFSARVGGRNYTVVLDHRRWQLPFEIQLEDFRKEDHPGTEIPSSYESDVIKVEGDHRQPVTIEMNEPLRHGGYILYQASWGPENAPPGTPLFSQFAVVRNLADQWPLYSCIVIALGLLVHFGSKLLVYLKVTAVRRKS